MEDAILAILQKLPTLWGEIVKGVLPCAVDLEPPFSSHPRKNSTHGSFREVERLQECDKAPDPYRFLPVQQVFTVERKDQILWASGHQLR
jgi:hypothetical protein